MASAQPTYDDILRLSQETDRKIKETSASIGRLSNFSPALEAA